MSAFLTACLSDEFLHTLQDKIGGDMDCETVTIGDDLVQLAGRLHVYQEFFELDSDATAVLQQLLWSNQALREFIEAFQADTVFGSNGVAGWLQQACVHVFPIFLKHALRVTPASHVDYTILHQARIRWCTGSYPRRRSSFLKRV